MRSEAPTDAPRTPIFTRQAVFLAFLAAAADRIVQWAWDGGSKMLGDERMTLVDWLKALAILAWIVGAVILSRSVLREQKHAAEAAQRVAPPPPTEAPPPPPPPPPRPKPADSRWTYLARRLKATLGRRYALVSEETADAIPGVFWECVKARKDAESLRKEINRWGERKPYAAFLKKAAVADREEPLEEPEFHAIKEAFEAVVNDLHAVHERMGEVVGGEPVPAKALERLERLDANLAAFFGSVADAADEVAAWSDRRLECVREPADWKQRPAAPPGAP